MGKLAHVVAIVRLRKWNLTFSIPAPFAFPDGDTKLISGSRNTGPQHNFWMDGASIGNVL
jgi:hypothetical protein